MSKTIKITHKNDLKSFEDIVKYIYKCTKLGYVMYEDKKYYPYTVLYNSPNTKSDDYVEKQHINNTYFLPDDNKIEYIIKYDTTEPAMEDVEDIYMLLELNKDTKIEGINKIIIKNKYSKNIDRTSYNDTILDFKCHKEYIVENKSDNMTLNDLANGLYRVKSCKYDNSHDLYLGCEITIDKDHKILTINVEMDHSS